MERNWKESMYKRAAPHPWQEIRTSQRSMRDVLSYIREDFLHLIGFMIIYRKYPYILAYQRMNDTLRFLDSFICKNKQKIIDETLFSYIENEDEAKSWIQVHFGQILEMESETNPNERSWELDHYIISDNISANAPRNLLKFKQLFLMAVAHPNTLPFYRLSNDIWRCACEYLLMERQDIDPRYVEKIECLLKKGLTDDDR